ncbi:MAG: GNAT family N-acetyltransferase [Erysipelotrichaceae bacterium]|nr:GNAT family N-acetyltransferase [Erysipelotrichaceae bacterium]
MNPDMCVPCGQGIINIRVGAIIMKGERFLMVRSSQSGYYYSVGGRIKFGETAEEAVRREVREETGTDMEIDRLGFILENYFMGDIPSRLGKEYYELAFYFYMKTPEDFEPVCRSFSESGHKEQLHWITRDEPQTIFPAFFRSMLDINDRSVRHLVTDERFYIRRFREADLRDLQTLLADEEVMKYLEEPYSLAKSADFLRKQGLTENPRILAVDDRNHRFAGYVIYHEYDEDAMEIGWVLKKEYWHQGLASLLTKQLIAMALAQGKSVVIECLPQQQATIRIAETNGFRLSGSCDDLMVYRRQKPEEEK